MLRNVIKTLLVYCCKECMTITVVTYFFIYMTSYKLSKFYQRKECIESIIITAVTEFFIYI